MRATVPRPIVQRPAACDFSAVRATGIRLELPPEDKLALLRALDEFHFWHSLDDCRHCKRCHRSITGHQVELVELKEAWRGVRLQCPTESCPSTPGEWVYSDPVLAAKLRSDFRSYGTVTPSNRA